jgi:hypothetical protein
MRSLNATVLGPLASGMVAAGLACRQAARAPARSPDAGAMVTVYVAPGIADRVMGRLQLVAARHQWALSVRTDSADRRQCGPLGRQHSAGLRSRRPGAADGGCRAALMPTVRRDRPALLAESHAIP